MLLLGRTPHRNEICWLENQNIEVKALWRLLQIYTISYMLCMVSLVSVNIEKKLTSAAD